MKSFSEYIRDRDKCTEKRLSGKYPEIEKEIERLEEIDGPNMIPILFSDGPDQELVRAWCRKDTSVRYREQYEESWDLGFCIGIGTDEVCEPEEWEIKVLLIGSWLCGPGLEAWEKASIKQRTKHAERIATLARKLADALEEDLSPGYFPITNWCERFEDYAKKIGDDSLVERAIEDRMNASIKDERLPEILRGLAVEAEMALLEQPGDARPNTGHSEARAKSRNLARRFQEVFGRVPNTVIAACIRLKYPQGNRIKRGIAFPVFSAGSCHPNLLSIGGL